MEKWLQNMGDLFCLGWSLQQLWIFLLKVEVFPWHLMHRRRMDVCLWAVQQELPSDRLFSCFHFWLRQNRSVLMDLISETKKRSGWFWTNRWYSMQMESTAQMWREWNSGVWRRSCGCCMNKRYYESTVEYKSQKCYNAVKYAKQ